MQIKGVIGRRGIIILSTVMLLAGAVYMLLSTREPVPVKTAAAGWSRWRGPNMNGISEEAGWDRDFLSKPLRINWKIKVGPGFSNISIYGDHLYTMGYDEDTGKNAIFCLKSKTGETVWKYTYLTPPSVDPYQGPRSTPVIDEGKVYTFGQNGEILCNDAVTGKFLWNHYNKFKVVNPPRALASSPLIDGDLIILNAFNAGMALNKRTGRVIWQSAGDVGNNSTPLPFKLKGKKQVILFGQHYIYGIVPENGKISWSYKWKDPDGVNAADPAIYGSSIFVSPGYHSYCTLLDLSKGKPVELWRNSSLSSHVASPIVVGNFVYGIDGTAGLDGSLTCLDLRDGSRQWRSGRTGCGNMIIAGDCIIMITDTGTLIVAEASPNLYNQIGIRKKVLPPICLTAPVLYESTLYLRNSKGDIISIDISER